MLHGNDDSFPKRHKKSSAERRAQRSRAEARVAQRLIAGFDELQKHRGCKPTFLGSALAKALEANVKKTEKVHDYSTTPSPLNSDAPEYVPQLHSMQPLFDRIVALEQIIGAVSNTLTGMYHSQHQLVEALRRQQVPKQHSAHQTLENPDNSGSGGNSNSFDGDLPGLGTASAFNPSTDPSTLSFEHKKNIFDVSSKSSLTGTASTLLGTASALNPRADPSGALQPGGENPSIVAGMKDLIEAVESPSIPVCNECGRTDCRMLVEAPFVLTAGDGVKAIKTFSTDSVVDEGDTPVIIGAGTLGVVVEVDDGDTLIMFDAVEADEWVYKCNLVNLQKQDIARKPEAQPAKPLAPDVKLGPAVKSPSIPVDHLRGYDGDVSIDDEQEDGNLSFED